MTILGSRPNELTRFQKEHPRLWAFLCFSLPALVLGMGIGLALHGHF